MFDSFDKFTMAYISPKYRITYASVNMLENVLASKVDVLITISEDRLTTFGKYRPDYNEIIMNCPEDALKVIKPSLILRPDTRAL